MSSRKLIGVGLLVALFVLGVFSLSQGASLRPETAARQQAISAMAPIGIEREGAADEAVPAAGTVAPMSVNLADVPVGEYDPFNQFDRWQRGELDLQELDGIRSAAELAALRAAAAELSVSGNVQNIAAARSADGIQATQGRFPSIDINGCCGGGANVPPDPEMAAGPNHLIAVVNVAFEIYNKSGTSLTGGPVTLQSFLGANPTCTGVFDPNVLYDEKADRWMIAADANGTHYCAAVSQTNNPLGSYWVYAFPTGSATLFFDYPHAGIGEDAIYLGANMFQNAAFFLDSRVWALDKAAMYTGASAAFIMQNLGAAHDTPQPLNLHGWNQGTWPANDTHYFFAETNFNGADHTLFSWDGPFSGPNTFATVSGVNLNTATGVVAGFPVNVTQAGGGGLITANDWRPLDFEYRNGYGWTTMTIGCNPGGGTVNCVRWAQINLNTGAIGPAGAGVFASNGTHRFFPDLAVNQCDTMAVGYSRSGSSEFPGMWAAGRKASTPPGVIGKERIIKNGEITYTAFDPAPRRWGDYTGMTIDPDGLTFWYLGEYSKNTGNPNGRWGTYIGYLQTACP
ncbi:MAG: hypothetical protein KC425_13190 [Anaerolineales bacterium]|nr:hypothetical protein [Anaerolineales bacterium]